MNDMTHWSTDGATAGATEIGAASLLLGGIVAEMAAGATAVQRRAFFRAAGARIAATHPIGEPEDLAALATSINRVWQDHGWGMARFEVADDGLLIMHAGAGHQLSPILGAATEQVLRPLLEGAYDAWLHMVGSGAGLCTRTLWWNEAETRLKHGR